jgi:hypothetical protein
MTGCRISKVTNKATGRELHILPTNNSLDNTVISLAADFLGMARRGEIKHAVVMGIKPFGNIFSDYNGEILDDIYSAIGGMDIVKRRLMEHVK